VLDGFPIRGVRSEGYVGAGAWGGILRRCIVTDNQTGASGAGVADATCESCVISGNKTEAYGGGAYN
jgi:hypothetical protein